MSTRSPRSLAALAGLAALFLVPASMSAEPPAEPGLEAQVQALTQRVAALEDQLGSLNQRVATNHPDAAMEQEAVAAFQSVGALLAAGRMVEAKPHYDQFMAQYGNTQVGMQARALEDDMSVIGTTAPTDWKIDRWYQGEQQVALQGAGPTMVVFWETWCPHCRREVPKLEELHRQFGDRGLQILGLTQLTRGGDDAKVREFIDQNELTFPMAKEDGSLSAHFGVSGIPIVAVVRDGRVVWRGHPARVNAQLVDSWLR